MNIEHDEGSRFFVRAGDDIALVQYVVTPEGKMDLRHTEVPKAFEGQGVASALVVHAFKHARESGRRVVVSCAFIRKWMSRHPEVADLVDED